MNLLSVSALMKEGATVHFEKGNSWLQHPDMPTRIMLEERRGLFVLPSSKLSGAVTVPDDEGQRVVGFHGLGFCRSRWGIQLGLYAVGFSAFNVSVVWAAGRWK